MTPIDDCRPSADDVAAATMPRIDWVDIARGIGIILVVFGHALRAIHSGNPRAPAWVGTTDSVIYAFHMPLFFVLAGLFLWRSIAKGRRRFFTDRLVTIVYPYVLWSLIEGGLEIALSSSVNTPITPHQLLMIPVEPIEQYWFLYALFLCQMIALVCYPRKIALVVLTALGVVAVVRFGGGPMVLRALFYLPFVLVGILAVGGLQRIAQRGVGASALLLLGGCLGFIAAIQGPMGIIPIALLAGIAGSLATIALSMMVQNVPPARAVHMMLTELGRASMAIYVAHTIASAVARVLLKHAGIAPISVWMLVLTTVAGLALPYIFWRISERVGLGTLLGFGIGARGTGLDWSGRIARSCRALFEPRRPALEHGQ